MDAWETGVFSFSWDLLLNHSTIFPKITVSAFVVEPTIQVDDQAHCLGRVYDAHSDSGYGLSKVLHLHTYKYLFRKMCLLGEGSCCENTGFKSPRNATQLVATNCCHAAWRVHFFIHATVPREEGLSCKLTYFTGHMRGQKTQAFLTLPIILVQKYPLDERTLAGSNDAWSCSQLLHSWTEPATASVQEFPVNMGSELSLSSPDFPIQESNPGLFVSPVLAGLILLQWCHQRRNTVSNTVPFISYNLHEVCQVSCL